MSRWGRLMVAFAAALAVWAVALPAFAAAPMCDPHGATGVAPAPQLQQPQTSISKAARRGSPIDVGSAADECDDLSGFTAAINHGRAPQPAPVRAAQDPVRLSVVPVVPPAGSGERIARGSTVGSERVGARMRVDRPPRLA